jgi:hypothetical protein
VRCGTNGLRGKVTAIMLCYRYVDDPMALASILAGDMKFTIPAELNDPSELFPKLSKEEVLESLRDLRDRGNTEAEFIGLKRQHALMRALIPSYWQADLPLTRADADTMVRLPIYDHFQLIEQLFLGMLNAMSDAIAVACLSKRWDSLPMWAHYARRARGAVVAYDNLEAVFPGDETGWLNCPKEVTYARDTTGISFYPDSYGAIFFSKLRDWAYESEVRIATELARCTKVQREGSVVLVRRIPVQHVSSIILGWRTPVAFKDEIIRLLDKDSCRHIQAEAVHVHRGQLVRHQL